MTSFPEYLNLIDDRSAALRAAVTAASYLSEAGAALDPARPGPAADAAGADAALHSPGARGGVAATVRGPASDILLALYSRIPLSRLQIDGDAGLIDRLQAWGDTE